MNWNAKPESTTLPPPYPKSQASILQQYLIHQPPTASQSSIIYPANNQEACMYSSNPNSVSQPLPNIRNYKTPQIPVSNMHNRTVVTSQTKVERITYGNVKGPQQPTHNLQVSSGIMQNVWLNSPIRNSMSSHTEAIVSHQTDFGANMLYVHVPQNQLLTSDTYSMQLQMTPSNSVRDPVTCQGNQGLNHSVPDQLVDWAQQYTSNELTYPDCRAHPKQYSYSPQGFLQDPTVQKQNIMPSTSLQVKNNQLSTSAQTLQAKHLVPVSFQYAMDTNRRPPPPSYNCRFGSQPGQAPQPAVKHLSVEIPQSSEVHSSEQRKDLCKRFQQQWQNANENSGTIGNVCEFNVKQPYNEPVRSSVEGAQTPTQNNQEKKLYSCNTNANLVLDTNITKEKLVRDIKSLVEIKKKFSELARKIKINKDLLMAAGCSKAANSSYGEPAQHCEFSTKGMPAKSDSHCSMELLATCLSLWKNQPPKPTGEKALKSSEEERCSKSGANIATDRSAKPVEVKSLCSAEGNSQKTVNPSQTVLSVVTQSYESSGGTVAKGTELQIAVVSPLILSSVKALPEKGVGSVGPLYPVVKEGSVCTLQNQLAEDTTLAAALNFDVKVPAAHGPLAEGSLPAQKEKGYESLQEYPQVTRDASPGKLLALDDQQALPKPSDSTVASGHTLQIESICSLAEGDVSYNSQIAEIFNSFPLKNDVLQKPLSPGQQLVSSQQKEQVGHTTSNNVFGFREDKSVQCTGNPHEVMGRPAFLQSLQPSTLEHAEADRETVEESNLELTTKTESTAKHACGPPAAPQQDPCPPEEEVCPSHFAQDPIVDEMCDEKEPVLCLHDQLSELLKEFPYGIEAVSRREGCVGQQKADQILENQTRDKTGCVSEDNTDQIQITILSSEQIKELFPEEDSQPCDIGRLAEPEKETAVAEVGSLCDPQALSGESCDPIMLDSEKDKIHCCALGWLSKVYEGVPQCRCGSSKSAGSEGEGENENKNGQGSPLETNSCRQIDGDVAVVEVNSVKNNLNTPLTLAEEGHPETHGNNLKTSKKTQNNSSLRTEPEVISQLSLKCESKDRKDTSKINQGSSLKIGQKMTSQFPSKCDKPDPLNSHSRKKALKFFDVSFNSCNNRPTFSEQVPQESLQKKHSPQNSGLLKAQGHLLPKKDLCRRNGSLVLSASPEKKKLKFKAGGSKLKYFEKRKTDHGIISDLEIKKKKYEKQDQPKNVGGTVSLCSTPTSPDEQSGVKEKMVSNSEPSDLKSRSSKTPRVITVKEYLQRQKNKDIIRNNASKSCVRNVPCGSEQEPSQLLAPAGWEKGAGKDSNSAESLRELGPAPTSSGKNKAEDPKTCDVSKRVQGKVDGKPPDKAWFDKTDSEKRLANVSNEAESGQLLRQAKEQRKLYLNRVAFKCTEKESICLTRLDSASQKVSKDRKSHENTPKTDDVKKPSLLEFKLCPDTLLKTTNSVDKPDNPTSGKDPASLQVSGIKSTKEDWLKCGPTRTKASETSQEIDNANSRVSKRSFSADGFETVQNPVKDSNTMFRTYKQMYLDKRNRSQSLESSSVK